MQSYKIVGSALLIALLPALVFGEDTRDAELAHADQELNRAYKYIIENLSDDSANSLRGAQRAWLQMRDLDCRWAFTDKRDCLIDRTDKRTAELKESWFHDRNSTYQSLSTANTKPDTKSQHEMTTALETQNANYNDIVKPSDSESESKGSNPQDIEMARIIDVIPELEKSPLSIKQKVSQEHRKLERQAKEIFEPSIDMAESDYLRSPRSYFKSELKGNDGERVALVRLHAERYLLSSSASVSNDSLATVTAGKNHFYLRGEISKALDESDNDPDDLKEEIRLLWDNRMKKFLSPFASSLMQSFRLEQSRLAASMEEEKKSRLEQQALEDQERKTQAAREASEDQISKLMSALEPRFKTMDLNKLVSAIWDHVFLKCDKSWYYSGDGIAFELHGAKHQIDSESLTSSDRLNGLEELATSQIVSDNFRGSVNGSPVSIWKSGSPTLSDTGARIANVAFSPLFNLKVIKKHGQYLIVEPGKETVSAARYASQAKLEHFSSCQEAERFFNGQN